MNPVPVILRLYTNRGGSAYVGEPVSQLEHALQTAHLATQADASDALIVAALLHDIGHLLLDDAEEAVQEGLDLQHEQIGMLWTQQYFDEAVVTPIRLHVAAKRYLAAVEPRYAADLSPASARSLALQGGPMTAAEAQAFERQPYATEATHLRRWDDRAKVPGARVAPLESYVPALTSTVLERWRS